MSSPCFKCGVRPDIACAHREADPDYQPPKQYSTFDPYKPRPGELNGRNFKRPKMSGGGRYRVKRSKLPA
jgi:hypothetical protein